MKISRVNARAHLPDSLEQVTAGHWCPECVVTRKVRFEDAAEAIGDPTIRVAFVCEGVD